MDVGSGLCYFAFDNQMCFKADFNKSENIVSLTPTALRCGPSYDHPEKA